MNKLWAEYKLKNTGYFLLSIFLLTFVLASTFFGGVLFDMAGRARVNGFIFQPNNLAINRVESPMPLEQVTDKFVRERLIQRFVTEYFYVIPDTGDIARRQKKYSIMDALATPAVFDDWVKTVIPDLDLMAGRKVLRRVNVNNILKVDEYYAVSYDLITWNNSNLIGDLPTVTKSVVYLQLDFANGIREEINNAPFDAGKYLERGGDPAIIFKFKVKKIVK